MRIKNYKLKLSLLSVINVGSLFAIKKWLTNAHEKREIIANNKTEYDQIQNALDSMPTTQHDYKDFLIDGDKGIIEQYNTELAQIKQSGDVAPSVLEKYGYESKEEFFENVDNFYELGKDGDLYAQELFNQHMTDYQNGPFSQACVNVKESFVDLLNSYHPNEFGMSVVDVVLSVPSAAVGIGAGIALSVSTFLTVKTLKNKKKSERNNSNVLKK